MDEKLARNIYIEIPRQNKPEQTLVIGAHYDSIFGSPGANDNASGVSALLELSQGIKKSNTQPKCYIGSIYT